MDTDDRRQLADANVIVAFCVVQRHFGERAGGVRRFGSVHAIATGREVRFFNRVMAMDSASRPRDVVAAIDWIEARGWPVTVQLGDALKADVRTAVEDLGLVADRWESPIMVLEPIRTAPAPPPELRLRIGGRELGTDFSTAVPSGPVLQRALGPAFAADSDVRLAVGYVEDAPVARAAAIRSGSTIGIYVVETAERFRRRGFGRAVTWAAIEAGVAAWGGSIAVLQSSEMGVPVYASMGFRVIARYIEFERPTD
jgi:ribosomal protein S18 acetylase RimI-like enzyme